ncbi:MAG: hypothetical protein L0H84_17175, partial [Pseudonocardia sp.]|nr:hypothetical protein [Pseudonocardia sp.]
DRFSPHQDQHTDQAVAEHHCNCRSGGYDSAGPVATDKTVTPALELAEELVNLGRPPRLSATWRGGPLAWPLA